MKGFEVTLRNKTSFGAATGNNVLDVFIERYEDRRIDFRFGGLNIEGDKDVYYTLDYVEDLETGDEVVIKIKEIDKVSEPIYRDAREHSEYTPDPDERAKMLQDKLDEFRELETKLKEAGLID
jgi:hypothetical protein